MRLIMSFFHSLFHERSCARSSAHSKGEKEGGVEGSLFALLLFAEIHALSPGLFSPSILACQRQVKRWCGSLDSDGRDNGRDIS